ncbi:hypothetical protein SAMN04489730_6410 [Amycolatopsis australiensis]|uniref:Uncharacterized protein n=1 Tax=Amycolatopsis australiensis TaxID=546364 RepID=A0A1K1SQH2_9PSEU|nr:hypothetical protein SAMN04489730_6410 [Amycolatopsis australiensis]
MHDRHAAVLHGLLQQPVNHSVVGNVLEVDDAVPVEIRDLHRIVDHPGSVGHGDPRVRLRRRRDIDLLRVAAAAPVCHAAISSARRLDGNVADNNTTGTPSAPSHISSRCSNVDMKVS